MNQLMEMLQRLFNEQKWREQKAQGMSSGLGSMPYNFDEQMMIRSPGLMQALQNDSRQVDRDAKVTSDPDATDGFLEQLLIRKNQERQLRERQRLNTPL